MPSGVIWQVCPRGQPAFVLHNSVPPTAQVRWQLALTMNPPRPLAWTQHKKPEGQFVSLAHVNTTPGQGCPMGVHVSENPPGPPFAKQHWLVATLQLDVPHATVPIETLPEELPPLLPPEEPPVLLPPDEPEPPLLPPVDDDTPPLPLLVDEPRPLLPPLVDEPRPLLLALPLELAPLLPATPLDDDRAPLLPEPEPAELCPPLEADVADPLLLEPIEKSVDWSASTTSSSERAPHPKLTQIATAAAVRLPL